MISTDTVSWAAAAASTVHYSEHTRTGRARTSMGASLLEGFRSLRGSPRELWFVYVLYIFAEYTYHAVGTVLASYATTEFGYSDVEAGALYGAWGVIISFWHFTLGSTVDALGIKRSLLCGFTFSMVGRALLTCATEEWHMLLALYGLGPLGEAIAAQTFQIGVCRYTHSGNRGVAYAVLYSALNFGGAMAGFVIDILKVHSVLVYGFTVTGYRLVLFSSLITAMICFFGVMGMRDGVSVDDIPPSDSPSASPVNSPGRADVEAESDPGLLRLQPSTGSPSDIKKVPGTPKVMRLQSSDPDEANTVAGAARLTHTLSLDFKPPEKNPLKILRTVLADRNFWRFVLLNLLIIPAALPVKYNNVLLPKYLVRLFGRDVPFGSIISINWVLCIFFSPLFSTWTKEWQHLDAIRFGTFFTGFATTVLVLNVSIPAICLWEVLFTIGENLYASRKYALAAELAPVGMEATFVAVAGLPSFVSTFPSGLLAGWLLDTFVPMCTTVTDFTQEDFCSFQATDYVNGTSREICMSGNVCERGSLPREGYPCVCDVLFEGQCNYFCGDLVLLGPGASVDHEGQCPTVCDDASGYESRPKQMWLTILCISSLGPMLLVAFADVLRSRTPGQRAPVTVPTMCKEFTTHAARWAWPSSVVRRCHLRTARRQEGEQKASVYAELSQEDRS